jgi:uncharacterized membrane protein YhaH (DUF805 family)
MLIAILLTAAVGLSTARLHPIHMAMIMTLLSAIEVILLVQCNTCSILYFAVAFLTLQFLGQGCHIGAALFLAGGSHARQHSQLGQY